MVKKGSRILSVILSMALVLSMVYVPAFAAEDVEIPDYIQTANIDGVEYLLFDSGADFVWLREHVMNKEDGGTTDAYYCTHNIMLTANIDMTDYNGTEEHPNAGEWSGIGWGRQWIGFSGIFDGNGHTISNIDVYNTDTVGPKGLLFNLVKDATIKNVVLQGTVNSNRYMGGVVGRALGSLTLENVVVNANLALNGGNANAVGGLIGQVGSGQTEGGDTISIRNCAAVGTFSSTTDGNPVGGLIGHIYGGFDVSIVNSYAAADLSSPEGTPTAGLIGGQGTETLEIDNCYYLDSMGPSLVMLTGASADSSVVGPDDPNVRAKSMTADEMKSVDFLTALKGSFKADDRLANGYPVPATIGAFDAAFLWDGMPTLTYSVGETFDLAGLTITASDGVDITSYATVSKTDALTADDDGATVTVTVTYDGVTESKKYTIAVQDVRELVVLISPTKTVYYAGERFDPTGMVIAAKFGDSTEAVAVTGYTYTPSGVLTTADDAIVVSYYGKDVTVPITVQESALDRIEVTPPKNLIYAANEILDPASFNVYAYYTYAPETRVLLFAAANGGDGYTVDVDKETGTVTVSYLGATDSFQACFLESSAPAIVGGVCQLENADHLVWFANQVNTYSKSYDAVLLDDVDLTGNTWFHPIGTNLNIQYTGSFDGRGHTVTLQLNEALAYMGLFGNTANAEIRNITVAGSVKNVSTILSATGGVVGYAWNTVIDNCTNEAEVYDQSTGASTLSGLGGIAGNLYGTIDYAASITNCVNQGSVTTGLGSGTVGGIVGNATGDTLTTTTAIMNIEDCRNEGAVSGYTTVGGIAGKATANIRNCHNSGTVTVTDHGAANWYAGGIIGQIVSRRGSSSTPKQIEIVQVSNTGDVTGVTYVGGIVGYVENGGRFASESYNRLSLQSAYNAGNITATGIYQGYSGYSDYYGYCGGIVGYNTSQGADSDAIDVTGLTVELENVYNTGTVTGPNYVGGIIGWDGNTGEYVSGTHTIQNVYQVGTVAATNEDGVAGAIVGCYTKSSNAELTIDINNAYYLDDASGLTAYNAVDVSVIAANMGARTTDEMKTMSLILGDAFAYDSENINGGYPILAWQVTGEIDCAYSEGFNVDNRGILYTQLEALMADVEETTKMCGETPVTAKYLPLSTFIVNPSLAHFYKFENTSDSTDAGYVSVNILADELENLYLYLNEDGVLCSAWDGHGDGWLSGVQVISLIEHTWDDGEITTEPTCTETGIRTYHCTVEGCDGTKEEPVAALGHIWVDGWCSRCGAQYDSDNEPVQDADGFYLIGTAEELVWLANYVDKAGDTINVRLTADITVGDSWVPIGTSSSGSRSYQGTFDGQNHTVTLNGEGLFDYANADIRNVTLAGSVVGSKQNTGALVNYLSGGSVDNCRNTATVEGVKNTGGLLGVVNGKGITVSNSSNSGTVNSDNYPVGGLIGHFYGTDNTITNCSNSGTVAGFCYVGGLIGYAYGSGVTVSNSGNSGTVSADNHSVGGLIGDASGEFTISNCFNSGAVSSATVSDITTDASSYAGGLLGFVSAHDGDFAVTNCYNSGSVSSVGDTIGGVVGRISSSSTEFISFVNCYSSGAVSTTSADVTYVGAMMGNSATPYYEFNNCYYLNTACEYGGVGAGNTYGTFTAEAKTINELRNLAAQLSDAYTDDGYWINQGYPVLIWQTQLEAGCTVMVNNNTGTVSPAVITNLMRFHGDSGDSVAFTVSCDMACVVAYTVDGGATYTKLTALANENGSYNFTIDEVTGDIEIAVAIKGDANGDGQIKLNDALRIQRYLNPGYTTNNTLDPLTMLAADANGDGEIKLNDALRIQRYLNPGYTSNNTLEW